MHRLAACIVILLAILAGARTTFAQDAAIGTATPGTPRAGADGPRITLGHREDALPFSHRGLRRPVGYSIDLCLAVVETMRAETGREVAVAWRTVTTESRIPDLLAGRIDIECGSTTITAERERAVAFSPVIFVSATRLMVRRETPLRDLADLAGRRVVATAATTNAEAVRRLASEQRIPLELVTETDHTASFARLAAGQADAFAGDEVLLLGLIASAPDGESFRIAGPPLSHEPYGLMFRRDDPTLAALVRRSFERLAREGSLKELHGRWFTWNLPRGGQISLPMSPELAARFRALGAPD